MRRGPAERGQTSDTRTAALVIVWLVGAVLLDGCLPGRDASSSGVEGQVLMGPMCPVVQAGQACPDQPFETKFQIVDRAGKVVAQGTADEKGQFRVPLETGEYLFIPVPPNPGGPPTAAPLPFRVEQGEWARLTVRLDSGIR